MRKYFILVLNLAVIALTLFALRNYYLYPASNVWFYFGDQWFFDTSILVLGIWKLFRIKKLTETFFPWIFSLLVPIILWVPSGNEYELGLDKHQLANLGVEISIFCLVNYCIETFILLKIINRKKPAH